MPTPTPTILHSVGLVPVSHKFGEPAPIEIKPVSNTRTPGTISGGNIESALLPSMEKGGKVKKTGLYKLHKGEKVVSTEEVKDKEMADKKTDEVAKPLEGKTKPTKFKRLVHATHIQHHPGGHLVHHFHRPYEAGMKPDETNVIPDGKDGETDLSNLLAHLGTSVNRPAPETESLPKV
jgi:hypothetical protein